MKIFRFKRGISLLTVFLMIILMTMPQAALARIGDRSTYNFDTDYTKDTGGFQVVNSSDLSVQPMVFRSDIHNGASGKSIYLTPDQQLRYEDFFTALNGGAAPEVGTQMEVSMFVKGDTGYNGTITLSVENSTGTGSVTDAADFTKLSAIFTFGSSGALSVTSTDSNTGFFIDDITVSKASNTNDAIGQYRFDDCESMLECPELGSTNSDVSFELTTAENHSGTSNGKSIKVSNRSALSDRIYIDAFNGISTFSTISTGKSRRFYDVSLWIKDPNSMQYMTISIVNLDTGGKLFSKDYSVSTTDWVQMKIGYPGTSAYPPNIRVCIDQKAGKTLTTGFYIDDICITEKYAFSYDDSPDAGNAGIWMYDPNSPKVSPAPEATLNTTAADVRGGVGKCAKISGRTLVNQRLCLGKVFANVPIEEGKSMIPGKKYYISLWLSYPKNTANDAANPSDTADFSLVVEDSGKTQYMATSSSVTLTKGAGYYEIKMFYTIPDPSIDTNKKFPTQIFIDQPAGANIADTFFVDDVFVQPVELLYTFDWDDEVNSANISAINTDSDSPVLELSTSYYNGITYASSKSLKVSGRNDVADGVKFINLFADGNVPFTADKQYEISMSVMSLNANNSSVVPFFENSAGYNFGEDIKLTDGIWNKVTFVTGLSSKPLSIGLRQSEGVPLISNLFIDDVSITELSSTYDPNIDYLQPSLSITDGNNIITNASGIKGVTAHASVSNFERISNKNAIVMIAEYNSNIELVNISFSPTVSLNDSIQTTKIIQATLTNTVAAGNTVKAFLWDSFNNLIPITLPKNI